MKQIIVIRHDLKMPAGKLGVQTAHAESGLFLQWLKHCPEQVKHWLSDGSKKICVRVESEAELIEQYKKALSYDIFASLVRDNANTFFKTPTLTCAAIGPYPEHLTFFDDLKLY